ncbi:hypothetical protein AB8U03_03565 [Clostridium sp. Mt-5]|uniref:Uncharacterized protein n=1 Tax=Clostridium moutaii TaxID=3240932 RepID=A0ABV4BKG1_9CLOT
MEQKLRRNRDRIRQLNKSVNWTADSVRSTAYRRREEILDDIVKWESMYGNS